MQEETDRDTETVATQEAELSQRGIGKPVGEGRARVAIE